MIQGRFAHTLNDMRGLIDGWSAPSVSDSISCGKVLLAVSGGIDSMCMAELFASVSDDFPFAVAHCNFNLRGEESDGDEALVRSWAQEHDVPFHSISFDTCSYASEHGISIEMAARDLRYGWFNDLCDEFGYCAVAVAHNANDNAETLMLNLLRGSGIRGIGGMKTVSELPCCKEDACSAKLIRPLLGFTRRQIEGYVFAHKVSYREDSTNKSSDYKRNCIRNEVFPIFERLNPSFIRTLNREMGYFSEISQLVDDICSKEVENVLIKTGHDDPSIVARIDINRLMSNVNWRYILYHILEPYGFSSSVLSSVEDLLTSDRTVSGKRFESSDHVLVTGRGVLTVCSSERTAISTMQSSMMPVRCAGTYHFNGSTLDVEVIEWTSDIPLRQPEGVLLMDAEKMRFPFVLRLWRNGDWFVPFGMKGRKKVSDLFADLKYDSIMKSRAVVLVDTMTEGLSDEGHVAGVAGVRIDDRYKVTQSTKTVIRLTLR